MRFKSGVPNLIFREGFMDIRQLFSDTVRKMKRFDFLTDFVRRKNGEKGRLSDEAAVYRKKNGRGNEFDLAIYQLNAKISEIDKAVDKCKIEMKSLKGSISEGLRECYAKSPDSDFTNRVSLAYRHIFGDKYSLVTLSEAGGIFGESKIVGAVTTHDKKKKCAVKECVKAGEKNQAGRITSKPEIVVWDYDEDKPEGEFCVENDDFKVILKRRTENEAIVFIKDSCKKPVLIVGGIITILIALFSGLSVLAGLVASSSWEKFATYFAAGAVLLVAFTVVMAAKSGKSAPVDGLWLTAFGVAIASGLIMFFLKGSIMSMIVPIFLLCYSVALFAVRFALRKREASEKIDYKIAFVAAGVYFALLISEADLSVGAFAKAVIASAYFVLSAAGVGVGLYAAVSGKREMNGAGRYLSLLSSAFALTAAVITADFVGKVISAAIAVVSIALYLYLRLKNEKVQSDNK